MDCKTAKPWRICDQGHYSMDIDCDESMAEQLAAAHPRVVYLATASSTGDAHDPDMTQRIERHRRRRALFAPPWPPRVSTCYEGEPRRRAGIEANEYGNTYI